MAKAKDGFTQNAAPGIECLALDIGGVFHADVWETVFERGLADNCSLTMDEVLKKGGPIWNEHAHGPSTEEAFWQSWETALGQTLNREQIEDLVDRHVWCDTSVAALVNQCFENGIDVCFVSNSTEFWFERQMRVSGLEPVAHRIKSYMSHLLGHPKTHPEGGLARLAQDRDPETILFVDDREGNTKAAAALGMQTLLYTRQPGVSLKQALSERLFGKKAAECAPQRELDERFDWTPA